jgi:iron(III) transport system substrate-binding protein
VVVVAGCRIESAAPAQGNAPGPSGKPRGEVWVYTSMYRHVLDALDPVLKEAAPDVTVHWFQAGSEKVAARLEAELASGGTQCDVLVTSDPFLYQRFKKEGRWLRYVSPNGVRTPLSLIDPDGHFASVRISTMVLVHRAGTEAPASFAALAEEPLRGDVVVGDPLTSGTAYSWAVAMDSTLGGDFFTRLRANGVRVGGGTAAVLQKVEGGEARVGVLLLENALSAKAKGSPIEIDWPGDGAVLIPGYEGILGTARNPEGAKAVVDALLSPRGQDVIARLGDMHAVDPRVPGPRGTVGLPELLTKSQPWSEAFLERGLSDGARVKAAFSEAFSR